MIAIYLEMALSVSKQISAGLLPSVLFRGGAGAGTDWEESVAIMRLIMII